MNEALNFFLDNENVLKASDAPDEAIDYIFMLETEDLNILAEEWNKREDEWKATFIYLIGNLKLSDNQDFILKGLNETSFEVVEETLLSLYQSITEDEDEPEISEEIKNFALTAMAKVNSKYPEIAELKDLLDSE